MSIEWVTGLIGLAGALLGAVIGAKVSLVIAQRNETGSRSRRKLENTFGMHREFYSAEMSDARTRAGRVVELKVVPSLKDVHWKVPSTDAIHLWTVMGFYTRLSLMLKHGELADEHVAELFGPQFMWWWVMCFKDKVPENWEAHPHLAELRSFFNRVAPDRMELWVSKAVENMKEAAAARSGAAQPHALPESWIVPG